MSSSDFPLPEWFQDYRDLVRMALERLERDVRRGVASLPGRPSSPEAIEKLFSELTCELERQTTLFLVASFEARLQTDCERRRNRRTGHGPFDRRWRDVARAKLTDPDRPTVREILGVWEAVGPRRRGPIRDYRRAYDYRNWLAHGRHFPMPGGAAPAVDVVYGNGREMLRLLFEETPRQLEIQPPAT